MTQKEANILVEIITKVMRKELASFKKQLLTEGYKPQAVTKSIEPTKSVNKVTEVYKNFRQDFKVNKSNQKPLSRDPVLNSLLMDCTPLPKEGSKEELALLEHQYNVDADINLPTGEHGGLMPTSTNVNHVIEAMNRDYSGMFKPKNAANAPKEKNMLRSNFMAAMEGDDFISSDEEEDFSFLERVS